MTALLLMLQRSVLISIKSQTLHRLLLYQEAIEVDMCCRYFY